MKKSKLMIELGKIGIDLLLIPLYFIKMIHRIGYLDVFDPTGEIHSGLWYRGHSLFRFTDHCCVKTSLPLKK